MASFSVTASTGVRWNYERTDDIATARDAGSATGNNTYSEGIAANQANVLYRARITLTLSQWIYDVDLQEFLDIYGDRLAMTSLCTLVFHNRATASGDNVRIGPQGATNHFHGCWGTQPNAWNRVGPGGILVIDSPVDGHTVSATQKIIRLRHDGVTYPLVVDFAVLGRRPI